MDHNFSLLRAVIENIRNDTRPDASDEEALGVAISQFCDYDDRILDVLEFALEDANFHSLNELIATLRKEPPAKLRELNDRINRLGIGAVL